MIVTNINSLEYYKSIGERMKLAMEYLKNINTAMLDDGKYNIDSDNIFANVSTYETRKCCESKYEAHRRYIDIQCLIEGEELIYYNDTAFMEADGEYNAEKDKINFKDSKAAASIHLIPGLIAIYYPSDAHKACCRIDDSFSSKVRKLVIKVKI